jgi:hypothetical protein
MFGFDDGLGRVVNIFDTFRVDFPEAFESVTNSPTVETPGIRARPKPVTGGQFYPVHVSGWAAFTAAFSVPLPDREAAEPKPEGSRSGSRVGAAQFTRATLAPLRRSGKSVQVLSE